MKRALSIAGLATAAVLGASTLAAAATPAQGTTSVTGVQVSAAGWVTGVNNRGDVIGGDYVGGQPQGFIWHAGTLTDLGMLPGAVYSNAAAVNDNGYVVGSSEGFTFPSSLHAFVWHNGTMTALPGPAGEGTSARYINDKGEIVGLVARAVGQYSVVVWQNGKMTTLPGLGGTTTTPSGLNQKGEVIGYADTASGGSEAVAWINGEIVRLGPGIPLAVNDNGAVLVSYAPSEGTSEAYVWSNGKTTELPVGTDAHGFNDQGEVVGQYTAAGASTTAGFSWQNGVLTNLGTRIPVAVDDRGRILFYVYDNGPGPFSSAVLDHGKVINLLPSASAGWLSDSGLVVGESISTLSLTAWQLPNG